jgi:hypothetical protein
MGRSMIKIDSSSQRNLPEFLPQGPEGPGAPDYQYSPTQKRLSPRPSSSPLSAYSPCRALVVSKLHDCVSRQFHSEMIVGSSSCVLD